MNENEFFREATLRICGNLAIEEAMFSTLQYLNGVMPATRMFIEYFDNDLKSTRTLARATLKDCERVDLLTPLSGKALEEVLGYYNKDTQKVYRFEHPEKRPLPAKMMRFHKVQLSSIILMLLQSGGRKLGLLIIGSEGEEMLSEQYADLFCLLCEPFSIAMSNTLKHRHELKLFNRDFFFEITKRICGNLEIEKVFRSVSVISQNICLQIIFILRNMKGISVPCA